ncbi:MAG: S8 family serine peptidase [Ignavibacteriales bacterium]|nr:S8 family serine peptidase [Ignavibacteriales bacterium]
MKTSKLILCINLFTLFFIGNFNAQLKEELKAFGSINQYEQESKPAAFKLRSLPQKPFRTTLSAFDERNLIEVKFIDNIEIAIETNNQPFDRKGEYLKSTSALSLIKNIAEAGGVWKRLTSGFEDRIESMRRNAELNANRAIANLNNYFILSVPQGINTEEWIDQLNSISEIEIAEPRHLPPPLPLPGNYQSYQGYLNAATDGIDANYAWSLNDSGQNVTICDFEYAWNLNHQDLPAGIGKLIPPGYTEAILSSADTNHGTAVLGVLASKNNGWGTKGAAYGATLKVAPTYFTSGWYLDAALAYAMTQLSRGDVFLIEQQQWGPYNNGTDTGLVPVEWDGTIYNLILTAVGNGFHVVEAGANGFRNLDSAIYNQNHAPFLPQNNSGAIIVGAGAASSSRSGSDTPRSRLSFSNYGSRLSLQGWGEKVTTTGTLPFCSALYTTEGRNYYYDSCFAGTSSASPVVAAAVALVESRFESLYGKEITPITMRTILANTGSAQQSGSFPSSQKIGPLPNVRAAIDSFASSTMTLSGLYTVGIGANYTNLTAVANELKQKIIIGNVVFEIQSTYQGMTETVPIVFSEYTTRGGNWTVTIRPASGVTSVVTYGKPPGHPYTTYPVIKLDGIDRMTLDGRPGGTGTVGVWIVRNTRTDSVGATVQFENDATNNLLTYLQIEGQNPTQYPGTVYFGGYSGNQGNSHNVVSYCDIRDRSDVSGMPAVAIYSDWTLGAANDSNSIISNNIYNWTGYGLYLYGERWIIRDNSLFEQIPQNSMMTGIFMMGGNGHDISDNYIGGGTPKCAGSMLTNINSSIFTGISLIVDTLQSTSIQGNRISNIACSNPIGSGFMGITILAGNANIGTIKRNVIGDSTLPGNISISGNNAVGGIVMNGIGRNIVTIENNIIANIDQTGVNPGELRGINVIGLLECKVLKNEIRNLGPSMPMANGFVRGIYIQGSNDSVIVANNMIDLGNPIINNCRYTGIYDFGMWGKLSKIYYNSVYIGGATGGPNNSYCLEDAGGSIFNVKNNIFHNARAGGPGLNYSVATMKAWLLPTRSDYNILYNQSSANLTFHTGMNMNFAQWQMATSGEANSINRDPKFKNPIAGDLHLDPANYSPSDNAGISISEITNDFDYQLRGGNPDIGADEYTINVPSAFSLLLPANSDTNQPRNGILKWQNSPPAGKYDVYLDTSTPPVIKAASDVIDTFYNYTSIDTNKTYYWFVIAKNSSGQQTSNSAPWRFFTGAGSSTGEITQSFPMLNGWNMLSLPLIVTDPRKETQYPTASSKAFGYNGSYTIAETLKYGIGYWLKFDSAESIDITGYKFENDTIDVIDKWNMIGCPSEIVPVDSIASIPGGIITSNFFGYDGSTYKKADTLKPGYGYWVKVNQAGQLILRNNSSMAMMNRIKIRPTFEMPPPPPNSEIPNPKSQIPTRFVLEQNYPNPFNPLTIINYQLPIDSWVTLKVYNVLGVEIAMLVNEYKKMGRYEVEFDASSLSSGIYYCRLTAEHPSSGSGWNFIETKKLILLR